MLECSRVPARARKRLPVNDFGRSDMSISSVHRVIHHWNGTAEDLLLQRIGDRRIVLMGEATHGTHEFYERRAHLTRRLIEERGFRMVVAEADWPDAYRVNRYVRGFNDDRDATEALSGFERFPQWMWRNAVVLDFVGWLRDHNEQLRDPLLRCGFYGMDLYSLFGSIQEVVRYLEKVDPDAAGRARSRYACFDHFGENAQTYAYAAGLNLRKSCEDEVVEQLIELQRRAGEYARRDGRLAEDEFFHAHQNARLVRNAEAYYRTMMGGRVESWNLRDRHMVETLTALDEFWSLRLGGEPTRMVVWAHNSHLGDARATEMGEAGEWNVGQLVREQWGAQAFNIGFSTSVGTVTAANDWDGPAEVKRVRPGLAGSYEAMFHDLDVPDFVMFPSDAGEALRGPQLQRAIGVIYRPETERASHYFHARLADQFDAMIHIDRTRAVEPLERFPVPTAEAETYPTGV
jgi:erythromycin esterase-like protein